MDILYLLIPLGMVFLALVIFAFMWAVKSGQYEDLDGPAHRILMDDDDPMIPHDEQTGEARDTYDRDKDDLKPGG
ncbi:MAG: cbb3-type cytochrome oxidase assembly protein CcoS [Thioalkalivibrio sp.]